MRGGRKGETKQKRSEVKRLPTKGLSAQNPTKKRLDRSILSFVLSPSSWMSRALWGDSLLESIPCREVRVQELGVWSYSYRRFIPYDRDLHFVWAVLWLC